MKTRWTLLLSVLAFSVISSAHAASTSVAVMPVRGVNLSEGQCDAIGILLTNAFTRDANVTVMSPMETRKVFEETKSSSKAAMSLGVSEYVELRAIQLEKKITLSGILYTKEGKEIFRSETAAPNLDEIEPAVTQLARSLIWRQPIRYFAAPPPAPLTESEAPPAPVDPNYYPKALGVKTGIIWAKSSGRSYSPLMMFQFDGRVGTRDYFFEFGVGGALPAEDNHTSHDIQMGGVFFELGGSYYLTNGDTGLYVGGGISPRIWFVDSDSDPNGGARCAIYGQMGLTFRRDSRARIYTELRVSQHVFGFRDTYYDDYSSSSYDTGDKYYPTEFALQFGIGW